MNNSDDKKKLIFNIVLVYTQLGNPDKALEHLNQIGDDEIMINNRKEIALIYESLAILFIIKYGENQRFKKIVECFQSAALYFAKCKEWSQCLRNKLEAGRILQKNNLIKESILIADEALVNTIYIDESNESAEIMNNLAILYSHDVNNKISSITSAKLLKKTRENFCLKKETIFILNTNYIGVLNQLGARLSKRFTKSLFYEPDFASQIKIFYLFNLASASFYSEDYQKALDLFLETLEIANKANFNHRNILNEIQEYISACYYKLDDKEKGDLYIQASKKDHTFKEKKNHFSKLHYVEMPSNVADTGCSCISSKEKSVKKTTSFDYQDKDTESLIDVYENLNESKTHVKKNQAKELAIAE